MAFFFDLARVWSDLSGSSLEGAVLPDNPGGYCRFLRNPAGGSLFDHAQAGFSYPGLSTHSGCRGLLDLQSLRCSEASKTYQPAPVY